MMFIIATPSESTPNVWPLYWTSLPKGIHRTSPKPLSLCLSLPQKKESAQNSSMTRYPNMSNKFWTCKSFTPDSLCTISMRQIMGTTIKGTNSHMQVGLGMDNRPRFRILRWSMEETRSMYNRM